MKSENLPHHWIILAKKAYPTTSDVQLKALTLEGGKTQKNLNKGNIPIISIWLLMEYFYFYSWIVVSKRKMVNMFMMVNFVWDSLKTIMFA